ncbi:MAG TPA: hypothetical protein VGK99_06265 [Acidobacteriota bacterium]
MRNKFAIFLVGIVMGSTILLATFAHPVKRHEYHVLHFHDGYTTWQYCATHGVMEPVASAQKVHGGKDDPEMYYRNDPDHLRKNLHRQERQEKQ